MNARERARARGGDGCCGDKKHGSGLSVRPPGPSRRWLDRVVRSWRRYSEPQITTAPDGPARARARSRATTGSGSANPPVSAASVSARRARGLLDWVAIMVGLTWRRSSTIAETSFSPRVENTATHAPVTDQAGKLSHQPAHTGRVVGAVPDLERVLAAHLHAPRDAHGVHRPGVDGPAQGELDGRERHRPVLILDMSRPRSPASKYAPAARTPPSRPHPPPRRRRPEPPPASRPRSPRASRPGARCARARRWSAPARASAASTFVASSRPPRPASTTAHATPAAAKAANAAPVSASNWVTSTPTASRTRSTAAS